MRSTRRQCPACDYAWSRYLDFPTCPRCGSDLVRARVRHDMTRTKRVVILSILSGAIASVFARLAQHLFG